MATIEEKMNRTKEVIQTEMKVERTPEWNREQNRRYEMENILSDNSFHLLELGTDEGLFMYTGIRKFGYTFEFPSPEGWVGGNMKQEIGCVYLCGAPYREVKKEMHGQIIDHYFPTPLIKEITEKYWEKVEKIQTNAADLGDKFAPLYHHYPGQTSHQLAYLELNPSEYTLYANYNAEVGNAIPSAVWYERIYRLPIPATLRGSAVAALLRDPEVLRLAEAVCEGHSVELDGNNQRGYYQRGRLTEDGLKALELLERELAEDNFSETDHVEVWEVGDWLSTWTPTPGETLEEAANAIEREAEKDGVWIVGDVFGWLQENHPDAE